MRHENKKPVVAIYLRYYLSPSETFVYRQLQGVSSRFHPIVLAAQVSNLNIFPTTDIAVQGKSFANKVATRLQRIIGRKFTAITSTQKRCWEQALTNHGADLVHAHFGPFGLDVLPIARALGVPLLVTFHGFDASRLLDNKTYTRELGELFEYAHVITVSQNMADRLAPFGLNDARHYVHYIGVPVGDFEFVEREPVRNKIGNGRSVQFLQVSNFVEKKGHKYTIEAFARYFKNRPDDKLILAGDGPLKREIESLCETRGIAEKVRFVGRVVKNEVSELMREADVFVHHSVTAANGDMEGIPTVIMEAMSMGLVVLSTNHSGIPELVDDGVDGHLVDERDIDGYVSKLESLFDSEPDVGRRARKKIEDKFNMTKQNLELQRIYDEVIDERAV